jgi:hypothetical protein
LIGAAILFFIAAWPFLLGTYIAVQCGAWNPSTERLVVGWLFEVVYVAGLVGWYLGFREERCRRAKDEAQLAASGAVYEAKSRRSVVYRHGNCTVDHKSPETAAGCRKSTASAVQAQEREDLLADTPTAPSHWFARPAVRVPSAILVVGFVTGLIILVVDPVHSAAKDAASRPCPTSTAISSSSALVTVPDVTGENAETAQNRLKSLGFANVVLSSANPTYRSVWNASNWTVLSTDPAPNCPVARAGRIELYVTK